jgi:hypothetical protein
MRMNQGMGKALKVLWMLAFVLALSGCAGWQGLRGLQPGVDTKESVLERFGKPGAIWDEADGGKTYEYSSQPFGENCYMVRLAPDGSVRAVDQVLDAKWLAKVDRGMTREQVRRLLGKERTVVFFSRLGEEVWDWNVDRMPGSIIRFNVHFKEGVVAYTSRSIIDEHEDRCMMSIWC